MNIKIKATFLPPIEENLNARFILRVQEDDQAQPNAQKGEDKNWLMFDLCI